MNHRVYCDCNSTTQIDPRVIEAVSSTMSSCFGNAASRTHISGLQASDAVESSRSYVSTLLNTSKDNLCFLSGATEANNLVMFGVTANRQRSVHVVATATEHSSIREPALELARLGADLGIVQCDERGQTSLQAISEAMRSDTCLVSAIYANNEVGTLNAVQEIGAFCRERGVLFHTDATQAVGKTPIDVSELPIDLMSFSAHKIYGPKGIGALYVRNDEIRKRIRPLIYGGGHEQGLRSGTLPVPLIVGFGKACELCHKLMVEESERIRQMRDRLWERFQSEIPHVVLNGHPTERLYNNLNVSFLGVPSEAFMIKLRDVVAVSAGSACTSANPEPSHVLTAMGVGHERLESAIRFGLGRFNTMEEIEFVADKVRDAVAELRRSL